MKYDVFISYASEDQKIVEALSHFLEADGIRCFIAYRDIPYGVKWEAAIPEAIENSHMMLAICSDPFNLSPQTDKELSLCSRELKPILPFRIEDIQLTGVKKYILSSINWIDAIPHPEQKFAAVKESVKSLLNKPSNAETIRETITIPSDHNAAWAPQTPHATDMNPGQAKTKPVKPDNYLIWSVLVLMFCCLPLGILALIESNRVNKEWDKENYEAARLASDRTATYLKIAVIGGIVTFAIAILISKIYT